MTNFLKRFAQDESGAVTVDYVVLAAAVVGLAIAVSSAIFSNVRTVAGQMEDGLKGVSFNASLTEPTTPADPG